MTFAIKAEVRNTRATRFAFVAQKTMYRGKQIARGDTIFVFASENVGGHGLVAREATNKIVGISDAAARFLDGFF